MMLKSLLKNDNGDENINENNKIKKEKNFIDATDLQSFFLFNNVILKNVMFLSQQTQSIRESFLNK